MKRLFTATLALALAVSMGVPAFAAEVRESVTEDGGSASRELIGEYVNTAGDPDTLIAADVSWNNLTFVYQGGSTYWDPATHADVPTPGAWESATKDITVTNHSNTGVHASVAFTPTVSGVVGSLSRTHLWLDSAVGKAFDRAPQESVQFGVSGEEVTQSEQIGTLTVTIEQDGRQKISDPAALTGGNLSGAYELENGMTLPQKIATNRNTPYAMIDMNGHTLTAGFGNKALELLSSLTLRNGTIENTSPGQLALEATFPGEDVVTEIYVDNCALKSAYSVLSVQQNTRVILHHSYLTAGAEQPAIVMDSRGGATLILSGTILLHGAAIQNTSDQNTVQCLVGEYDFDPTAYVDTSLYTVIAPSDGNACWIVTAK